jgi:transposase
VTEVDKNAVLRKALMVSVDQQEQIAQLREGNAQLREQNAQQAERIADLEALVEQLREELDKNSSNSSKPPSSDSPSQREKNRAKRKRREKKKRRRGGQPGHKGSARQLIDADHVDAIKDHYPTVCKSCWQPLPQSSEGFSRFQVTDLTGKGGGVFVVEHRRHSTRCSCGFVTKADRTQLPRFAFGPRLCATVVLFTGFYHLSRRQVQQMLFDVFGICIALGSISNIEARMSPRLEPGYAQARAEADQATVKHTDGTGWRRAGKPLQLWTVATKKVTVFSVLANGTSPMLKSLFGRIKGILISDRAKALSFWNMKRRQICWAHLRRKFISFSERDGPAGTIGKELVEYSDVVFETHRAWASGDISRRVFRERMMPVREGVEALLQKAVDKKTARLSGSCADILAHKEALWTYVDRPHVEPTNNHAERELRSFVLWRKRSFGSQSERGDRFAERVMTTVHSLRKQRRAVLPYLTALLIPDPAARPKLIAA